MALSREQLNLKFIALSTLSLTMLLEALHFIILLYLMPDNLLIWERVLPLKGLTKVSNAPRQDIPYHH